MIKGTLSAVGIHCTSHNSKFMEEEKVLKKMPMAKETRSKMDEKMGAAERQPHHILFSLDKRYHKKRYNLHYRCRKKGFDLSNRLKTVYVPVDSNPPKQAFTLQR